MQPIHPSPRFSVSILCLIGHLGKCLTGRVGLAALILAFGLALSPATSAQNNSIAPVARAKQQTWSVVTLRNTTGHTIHYQLRSPGGAWKEHTVEPKKLRMHGFSGQNVEPEIRYNADFAEGYQEQTYILAPRDFVGIQPTKASDGLVYSFR